MNMDNSLFKEFNDLHPEFINEINLLPDSLSIRFLNKFNSETDKTNFLSRLSEFKFVQFFDREGLKFDYDTTFKKQKPDIKIKLADTEIIADIKRFNLSELDQDKEDFFYRLTKILKTIKVPYKVRIKQEESFDYKKIDIEVLRDNFEGWIKNKNISVGDIFNYQDLFNIEIVKRNKMTDYVQFTSYSTFDNKINPHKILNIVSDKINIYQKNFIDNGFPFFICVDIVFETLITPEDFELRFLGDISLSNCELQDSISSGGFNNDDKFAKIIGLLIRYNGDFYWIHNPKHKDFFNFKTIRNK